MMCCHALAQLQPDEKKGITETLSLANLRIDDLKFPRIAFRDPWRLSLIDQSLTDPLQSADSLLFLHESVETGSAAQALGSGLKNVFGINPKTDSTQFTQISQAIALPEGLKNLVLELIWRMQKCDTQIKVALSKLTPAEQRELIEGLPVFAVEEPKVKFDFVKQSPLKQSRILDLMKKVDQELILSEGAKLTADSERIFDLIRAGQFDIPEPVKFSVQGLNVLVCGSQNDVHNETDARLTIDLGGSNSYFGRHGAGVGYSSILMDCSGNLRCNVRDLSMGAAVLGVGLAFVGPGDSDCRSKSLAFGSACGGLGVYSKQGGTDHYRSSALSQGFGIFGFGLLLDSGGDDDYNVGVFGQGSSRTQGLGWLIDRSGNDSYRCGGVVSAAPLFEDQSSAFSQGFSMGYRDDLGGLSGGVGLLTDFDGDDVYVGETYQQAASYWYAVGSLYDKRGNDSYVGHHYCQASAMHSCSAFLFDLAGSDSYVTRVGASLAIGHDYGVAFLLDRAGDDLYIARDSNPAIGSANGLGIFVESAGNDRYDGPEGQGLAARGSGSLGVFVDLGGNDKYRSGLNDGSGIRGSHFGVAFDQEDPVKSPQENPEIQAPKVGSIAMVSETELEKIYSQATQWGVGSAQVAVRENVNKLIGMGVPAFEWMVAKHLANSDRLQVRTFVAVAKALGSEASTILGAKIFNGSKAEKRQVMIVAMDAGIQDIGSVLLPLLSDPELQSTAVKAAGALKAIPCLPELNRLCLSDDLLVSRSAIVSISQIGSEDSLGTAQGMLRSKDFLAREAAIELICKFPSQAKVIGESMVTDFDESRTRIGIRLLAAAADYKAIASMLLDPRPGVRIECLQALNEHCPSEYAQSFLSLEKDPVALVRAIAKKVRPNKGAA